MSEEEIIVTEGYGVGVFHGDATGVMNELPGVLEVEPPKAEMADVETSHMKTPGRAKTYKPGWCEPGEMTVTIHHDPTVIAGLHATRAARTVEDWKVVFVDDPNPFVSKGYIKSIGPKVEREGLITNDITIKLSGVPSYAAA